VNVLPSFVEGRVRSIPRQSLCRVNRRDEPRFCTPIASLNVHYAESGTREPIDLVCYVNDAAFS
jgi:hypothetical protein